MYNQYKGKCYSCGKIVPKYMGNLHKTNGKYVVTHQYCTPVKVNVTTFSSGDTIIRNVNGLCEDAPCCGCCTG